MEFRHSYKNYYVLLVTMAVLAASISLVGFAPLELISSPQSEVPSGFFPPIFIALANAPFVMLIVTQIILVIISGLSFVRFTKSEISLRQKYVLLTILLVVVCLSSVFSNLLVPQSKELRVDSMSPEEIREAQKNGENVFLPID